MNIFFFKSFPLKYPESLKFRWGGQWVPFQLADLYNCKKISVCKLIKRWEGGEKYVKTAIPILDNGTKNEYKIDFFRENTFIHSKKNSKKKMEWLLKYTRLYLEETWKQ